MATRSAVQATNLLDIFLLLIGGIYKDYTRAIQVVIHQKNNDTFGEIFASTTKSNAQLF